MASRGSELPSRLAEGRRRLERWRDRRDRSRRIPEALWSLAEELAGEHGLAATARALKLDYYSLKKRLDAGKAADGGARGPMAGSFIELVPAAVSSPAEYVVEMEDAGGTRMRVHVKGGHVPEMAALVRSFREGSR